MTTPPSPLSYDPHQDQDHHPLRGHPLPPLPAPWAITPPGESPPHTPSLGQPHRGHEPLSQLLHPTQATTPPPLKPLLTQGHNPHQGQYHSPQPPISHNSPDHCHGAPTTRTAFSKCVQKLKNLKGNWYSPMCGSEKQTPLLLGSQRGVRYDTWMRVTPVNTLISSSNRLETSLCEV